MKLFHTAKFAFVVMIALVTFSFSGASASAHWDTSNQHQGVPAYFYPDVRNTPNNWYTMCSTMNTSQVGSVAIMNPDSGPGTSQNSAYVAAVDYCHKHGQNVIGYVHTSYGSRDVSRDVKPEVDKYYLWYDIDGIFVDEMSNNPSTKSYYLELYSSIHQESGSLHHLVVGNPGAAANTDWQLADKTVDALVVFEGCACTYTRWTPPPWVLDTAKYPADKFWNLVYNAPDSTTMQSVMSHSKHVNAGYMYVTSGDCANPWQTFPSYWSSELDAAF